MRPGDVLFLYRKWESAEFKRPEETRRLFAAKPFFVNPQNEETRTTVQGVVLVWALQDYEVCIVLSAFARGGRLLSGGKHKNPPLKIISQLPAQDLWPCWSGCWRMIQS